MRKLPLIWLAAISLVASVAAVGQGCGSSDSTGGGGPGGSAGTAGGTSTNPTAGGTTNTSTDNGGGGSTTTTTDNGGGGTSTQGTGGSGGAGGASCDGVMLTVIDADSWCHVSVNGSNAVLTPAPVCVPAHTKVALYAEPENASFLLSQTMWHHVDGASGDTGVSGDQQTMAGRSITSKTVGTSGAECVWVCCPGVNDEPFPCPTTDQCP